MNAALRTVACSCALAGAGLLGLAAADCVAAAAWQRHAEQAFLRERSAPPAVAAPQPGGVIGELRVPRLAVDTMVAEGDTGAILGRGAGHIPGTALPGSSGNVGIAAHRDSWFRPLRAIRPGDLIDFTTLQGDYRYRVVSTEVVKPTDVAVLRPGAGPELTLVTCYPFYFVGSAPDRFIVHAEALPTGVRGNAGPETAAGDNWLAASMSWMEPALARAAARLAAAARGALRL